MSHNENSNYTPGKISGVLYGDKDMFCVIPPVVVEPPNPLPFNNSIINHCLKGLKINTSAEKAYIFPSSPLMCNKKNTLPPTEWTNHAGAVNELIYNILCENSQPQYDLTELRKKSKVILEKIYRTRIIQNDDGNIDHLQLLMPKENKTGYDRTNLVYKQKYLKNYPAHVLMAFLGLPCKEQKEILQKATDKQTGVLFGNFNPVNGDGNTELISPEFAMVIKPSSQGFQLKFITYLNETNYQGYPYYIYKAE